ncbi:MAG TPA: sigma-54 dependent transcriptional regulator, partial [Terriglobia bacterium]|nr:sigma-54 dependent transcriptional regulator [Terriglobia bacterium]
MKSERIVLLVGCDPETRLCLEPTVRSLGFMLEVASTASAVRSIMQAAEREFAALIIDAIMHGEEGFEMVRQVRAADPRLPVIVVTGRPSTTDIVTAMKCGATDFLSAPITRDRVMTALSAALEGREAERVPGPQNRRVAGWFSSANPRMMEIQALIGQIGQANVPVLIQGETGSGKEVLARALHTRSSRASRPFLKLNCAALPSELVESELFGYEPGAFTGAYKRKQGMFELADGGTLLLDEIGDMDVRLQAKLLQVLQDREFRRIGGKEIVSVDVRIIAATHRDLDKAVQERTFREDLYYRLNVVSLVLPPLRDRKEDIIPIAEFLMTKHAAGDCPAVSIDFQLRQAMLSYSWPGNVRELENYVRKLLIFRDCSLIVRELRARAARNTSGTGPAATPASSAEPVTSASALKEATRTKERAETEVILAALNSSRWNRKRAAAMLNVNYKTLLYKMKQLGI